METISYLNNLHDSAAGPFLSPAQLSRLKPIKNKRKYRNALYKYTRTLNGLSETARQYHKSNPKAHGVPRSYTIRVLDHDDDDKAAAKALHGETIVLGAFGLDTSGLNLCGYDVHTDDVTWSHATKSCVFVSQAPSVLESAAPTRVSGRITFDTAIPTGAITLGLSTLNVELDPAVTWYNVDVSHNAGARMSGGVPIWNVDSPEWKAATWETGKCIFGNSVVNTNDDPDDDLDHWVTENRFIDTYTDPETRFDLTADHETDYDSHIDREGCMDTKTMIDIPLPPMEREKCDIKTVFPKHWRILFNATGNAFTGAYLDDNEHVYAVKGLFRIDDEDKGQSLAVAAPSVQADLQTALPISQPQPFELTDIGPQDQVATVGAETNDVLEAPPAVAAAAAAKDDIAKEEVKVEHLPVAPAVTAFASVAATSSSAPKLAVEELFNFNPMQPDGKGNYVDVVADVSTKDFQDIIIYHMDEDLRNTFIQSTAIELEGEVLAIANDDPNNADFYKKLQVPLIASILSQGTSDPAKHLNGARAQAQLKSIPVDSEVYKRHSEKLYRYRFKQKFGIQRFLDDQYENPRPEYIDGRVKKMKSDLAAKTAVAAHKNPKYAEQLKAAQDQIDALATWSKDRRFYWAFELLRYFQASTLPYYHARYVQGKAGPELGRELKQFNALFGVLERDIVNTAPGGISFMQAFNEDVRLFQMTAILPQLVDLEGNLEEIDNLMKQSLESYMQHYKDSDVDAHQEALKAAMQLHNNEELRINLFRRLAVVSRFSSTAGTWGKLMQLWQVDVEQRVWYRKAGVTARVLGKIGLLYSAILIITPLATGKISQMDSSQKAQWIASITGIFSYLLLKAAQGAVRLYYLWNDIAGFGQMWKTFYGTEKFLEELGPAAGRVNSGFARWFSRTPGQTKTLAKLYAAEADGAVVGDEVLVKEGRAFSRLEKIFGRNLTELLAGVIGIVLGVLTLVLTALDLKKHANDPTLQTVDALMIISASIQILAIVAGWVAAAAPAITILSTVATWGGPIAMAFAAVGLIVFFIWASKQDIRDPITKFVEDKAKPAGLWVDNPGQAPDYIQFIPPRGGEPSKNGLSFSSGGTIFSGPKFLKLNSDSGSVVLVDSLDYSPDTVWGFETDSNGYSLIGTKKRVPVSKDSKDLITKFWFLGTSGGSLIAREMSGDRSGSDWKIYRSSLHWEVDLTSEPKTSPDSDGIEVLSCSAQIKQSGLDLCLFRNANTVKLADKDEKINGESSNRAWELMLQEMAPQDFEYSHSDWVLTTKSVDEINTALFRGEGSSGLSWSIEPALDPKYFELVTTDVNSVGSIRQKPGVTAPEMGPTKYTTTCVLKIQGKETAGRQTASFTLTVKTPEAATDEDS